METQELDQGLEGKLDLDSNRELVKGLEPVLVKGLEEELDLGLEQELVKEWEPVLVKALDFHRRQ